MQTIGQRIAEFRKARGLSQEALGAIGGVKRLAQNQYETGKTSPNLDYLAALHSAGADVLYIVTGQRAEAVLSAGETQVLDTFRALTDEEQGAVLVIMSSMVGRTLQRPTLHSQPENYRAPRD